MMVKPVTKAEVQMWIKNAEAKRQRENIRRRPGLIRKVNNRIKNAVNDGRDSATISFSNIEDRDFVVESYSKEFNVQTKTLRWESLGTAEYRITVNW